MNNGLRYSNNRLMAVLVLFGLVMIGLGFVISQRLDYRINEYGSELVQTEVRDAGKVYSERLMNEMYTMQKISMLLKDEEDEKAEENMNTAISIIENVYRNEPGVILGILAADGEAIYGDKLSIDDYEGILTSLHGYNAISYLTTGGVLFSYPVLHGDNVHYVLYKLCSSTYLQKYYGLDGYRRLGKLMLMSNDGNIVVTSSNISTDDVRFYNSRSAQNVFSRLRVRDDVMASAVALEETVDGEQFFYSAEIENSDLFMAGSVSRSEIVSDISFLKATGMGVYYALILLVMILAIYLIIASVKVRESEELKEAKAVAEQASNAKSVFLANMSHEIRTPINAILGMDEMILREYKDPSLKQYAFNIKNAATTLLSLVNDVLDFSRIEAGKISVIPEEYDLSLLVSDIVFMMRERANKKNLYLNVSVNKEMPAKLIGDEKRVKQIIINLVTNAIKYTNEGGTDLIIDYEKIDDETIYFKGTVKDTGIGMKPEDIEKVFNAFERFDEIKNRTIEGAGLGMSIVKQLLNLMEGDIDVKSTYGVGSEFSFRIKQKVESFEPIGEYEKAIEKLIAEKEDYLPSFKAPDIRILAVDDTEINLTVLQGLLKQTLVKIDTCTSGEAALEKLKDNRYDIMLIDHRMPHMDGIELLKKIRSDTSNDNSKSICIALTANVISGSKEMYLREGFNDYMEKPVIAKKLEDLLLKYIPEDKLKTDSYADVESAEALNSDEQAVSCAEDVNWDEIERLDAEGIINIENGIEFSGTKALFIDTLKFFRDSIDDKADEIEEFYFKDDFDNYRTKVHALKSSAKLIGATKLSEKALALEQAAKINEIDFIRENNYELLSEYRSFKDILKDV